MKVLIIEDNAEVVEAVSLCLQIRWPDADISYAYGGLTGVQMVEAQPYDIVILDLKMPGMDGIATLTSMKNLGLKTKTLILTGHATINTALKAVKLGAEDYITKPCELDELVEKIEEILKDMGSLKKFFSKSIK